MMLSLEIGHREIRAVVMEGSAVKKKFTMQTPAVVNGLIGNIQETADIISGALKENNARANSCCFVLPSGSAVIRELDVPQIVQKDMLSYIRTQFAGVMEVQDQDIVDYIVTDKGKEGSKVLGLLLPRVYIEQCIKTAKSTGLKCQKVDVRANSLRKYLEHEPLPEDNSYIVGHLENGIAEINLFEGEKLFVRVSELNSQNQQGSDSLLKNWATSFNDALVVSSEQDTWVNSFAEQLESIINFQFSRNRLMPVTHVYINGKVDIRMKAELERILQMPVELLCAEEQLPYVDAMGSVLDVKVEQDINLLEGLKRSTPKQRAKSRKYYTFAAIILGIIVIELAAGLVLGLASKKMVAKTESIQKYLTGEQVLNETVKAQEVKKVLGEQRKYNKILKSYSEAFETVTRFSSKYLGGINQEAKTFSVALEYCNYEDGVVSITGYADDSSVAAQFAGALESKNILTDVAFEGYEKNAKSAGAKYKFQISGTIGGE